MNDLNMNLEFGFLFLFKEEILMSFYSLPSKTHTYQQSIQVYISREHLELIIGYKFKRLT